MKRLVYIAIAVCMACCARTGGYDESSPREYPTDSLATWTADTILQANMPLVRLMDTLYRFVRSSEYDSNSLADNIKWMDAYRAELCDFYDRNDLGDASASPFDKADSVIQAAHRLWDLDENYSTMDLIINGEAYRTRIMFQHYNEFSKLRSLCDSSVQRQLLENEFAAWTVLEKAISNICDNLTGLAYCGGSGAGPVIESMYIEIIDSHIRLYTREREWLTAESFETDGVYPSCGKQLLIDCCKTAYVTCYYKEFAKENKYYQDIAAQARKDISALPPIIDQWLKARAEWVSVTRHDWNADLYDLNTGAVLMRLSSIVCYNLPS